MIKNKSLFSSYLSLFSSFGTIICCALPSLLVSIGMGTAFAGFVGVFPQIVWLSENKFLVFSVSAFMILGSSLLTYWNANASCPLDDDLTYACKASRRWSVKISFLAVLIWSTGFIFAFIAPLF